MAGMRKASEAANNDLQGSQYPYILLDQSQKGQLSPYRLFTDIFTKYPICFSLDGMKAYVVGAQDFELFFDVISENDKFSANERSKPRQKSKENTAKEVCKTENDSESDWESIDTTGKSQPDKPRSNCTKRSSSERRTERIKRRYERALY